MRDWLQFVAPDTRIVAMAIAAHLPTRQQHTCAVRPTIQLAWFVAESARPSNLTGAAVVTGLESYSMWSRSIFKYFCKFRIFFSIRRLISKSHIDS
jgi:hypothetical protein